MLPILLITVVGGVLAWELTQGKLSTFLGTSTKTPTPTTTPALSLEQQRLLMDQSTVGLNMMKIPPLEMRQMPPVYSDVTASHGVPLTALVTQQATGIAPNLRTVALPYLGSRIL